jgi:hypothetical protein
VLVNCGWNQSLVSGYRSSAVSVIYAPPKCNTKCERSKIKSERGEFIHCQGSVLVALDPLAILASDLLLSRSKIDIYVFMCFCGNIDGCGCAPR